MLRTLTRLLHHLLTTALPLLSLKPKISRKTGSDPQSAIEPILTEITTQILYPLVRAFAPVSEAYLAALFLESLTSAKGTSRLRSPPPSDLRPEALTLFRSTTLCLVASSSAFGLKESLALDTLRELSKVVVAVSTGETDPEPRTRTSHVAPESRPEGIQSSGRRGDRVRVLAHKDTLWYLCAVLHIVFNGSPSSAGDSGLDVGRQGSAKEGGGKEAWMQSGLLDSLLGILSRCKHHSPRGKEAKISRKRIGKDLIREGDDIQDGEHVNERYDTERNATQSEEGPTLKSMNVDGRKKERLRGCNEVEHEMILAVVEQYLEWSRGCP